MRKRLAVTRGSSWSNCDPKIPRTDERTCELAAVAHIQDRDWYYEGALQLMPHQGRNGAFQPEHPRGLALDATCFAVLFLKKASLAAVTGG